ASLTLTHNSTSFILPGAANITTAAGDEMLAISEGAGNWRIMAYWSAAGPPPLNAHNPSDVSSKTTAFHHLSPLHSPRDLITRDASNNIRLQIGTANQLLSTDGTDAIWRSVSTVLDNTIGSSQGTIPIRGASAWGGGSLSAISPTVDVRTSSATITIPTN